MSLAVGVDNRNPSAREDVAMLPEELGRDGWQLLTQLISRHPYLEGLT